MYKYCSVAMSVYKNDREEWVRIAIDSLLNQTNPSNDVIIVVDGPIAPQLDTALRQYENEKQFH